LNSRRCLSVIPTGSTTEFTPLDKTRTMSQREPLTAWERERIYKAKLEGKILVEVAALGFGHKFGHPREKRRRPAPAPAL